MVTLIIGYPDSGKSAMAEEIITKYAGNGGRYYIATMIPYGEEGENRVSRHRSMREGKGFTTIEQPYDADMALHAMADPACSDVLLECVSNLTANELFERHTEPAAAADKITGDIWRLAEQVRNLVIVTNHYEIEDGFDRDTVRYSETLDKINEKLRAFADQTIRLQKDH